MDSRFDEVNTAYEAFAAELKAQGIWDSVVTIQTSDFGRTLSPNGNDGTDHAWAGNYMMMGKWHLVSRLLSNTWRIVLTFALIKAGP